MHSNTLASLRSALVDHYRIEREVGAGGMATVFLATDLRHDRQVAIKVLRPELSALLGTDRFLREITTTAGLQHPHILPLFDSGSAGELLYFVMPFVEGETLRKRLDRERQLGVTDAVRIAREVADALDHAHRRGVIHRDIKPENILLSEGRAMVADFGVALAVSAASRGRMTESGIAVGTPTYMSPEQATADRELSARADIYSLGAVLYEMLTGAPPHTAPTVQQLVMKIAVEDAPRVTTLRATVPVHVADAVATALAKLPADRFASATAFAEALGTPPYHDAAGTARSRETRIRMPVLAAIGVVIGVAVGFSIGGLLSRRSARSVPPSIARFAIVPPDSASYYAATGVNVAFAPDGSRVVYVGRSDAGREQLYQRPLEDLDPRPIAGTDAARIPTFSPDGERIAFTAGGALRTVARDGGPALTVVPNGVPAAGGGIAWGDDGRIYFVDEEGAIRRVLPGGGELATVARPAPGARFMWIDALPGTRHLLATVGRIGVPDASEIVVVPTEAGDTRALLRGTMGRFARSGHLVFATVDGVLMTAPFDAARAELTGATQPLFSGVDVYMGSASQFALSHTGALVWVGSRGLRELVTIDRRGAVKPIHAGWTADIRAFSLAPDGSRLALTTVGVEGLQLAIKPRGAAPAVPLVAQGTRNMVLGWSSDGSNIVVRTDSGGTNALRMLRADGSGRSSSLPVTGSLFGAEWSQDGSVLVAVRSGAGAITEIIRFRPGVDSVPSPLLTGGFLMQYARLSPDRAWLAYSSSETGRDEVFVRPFPSVEDATWRVSTNGGIEPVWRPDGRELFYHDAAGDLMSVSVAPTSAGAPSFSAPRALFPLARDDNTDGTHYQVLPDGEHFVVLQSVGGPKRNLMVVERFDEELRRKAPR